MLAVIASGLLDKIWFVNNTSRCHGLFEIGKFAEHFHRLQVFIIHQNDRLVGIASRSKDAGLINPAAFCAGISFEHEARPVGAALPHTECQDPKWAAQCCRVINLAYEIAVMAIASALAFGIIWSIERFAKRAVRRHDWRAMHTWFGWRK